MKLLETMAISFLMCAGYQVLDVKFELTNRLILFVDYVSIYFQ